MRKHKVLVPVCLLVGVSTAAVAGYSSLELEPCINGAVSASGAFPSNAAELRFHSVAELEPCINGEVPPSGVYSTVAGPTVVFATH